jgi:uncharacterized repeat protein (TIGR03803 family)
MFPTRALALFAALILTLGTVARGQIAISPIDDQTIPSGKTLVVPIPAADTSGSARSYVVTVSTPTVVGTSTPVANAGINAVVRTGDPHMIIGVSYTAGSGSSAVLQTGTMEFQLLREMAPQTTRIISGLCAGGFYSPRQIVTTDTAMVTSTTTKYITFHRVLSGFVIQGGDPNGDGSGGPGFSFPNEFSSSLIFSSTEGQLAMANAGSGVQFASGTTSTTAAQGSNGSQFFVTLNSDRSDLDFGYTIFGHLIRGYDTLEGISNVAVQANGGGEDSSPVDPVDFTSATITQNNTDAVLLLSATGVCQATVTVTAITASGSTSQTFVAKAQSDIFDDPPFMAQPPDIVSPTSTASVTYSGTDLQLDFLRYGFWQILPATADIYTSGSSPKLSVPLVSNTDNVIAGLIDHWNLTARTPFAVSSSSEPGVESNGGVRLFHVGANNKPITGTLAAIPGQLLEASGSTALIPPAATTPLVTFVTANTKDTAENIKATVNWGDDTLVSTGTGTVTIKKAGTRYSLFAQHAYGSAGQFPILVTVADPGGARLSLTGTANVSGSGSTISLAGSNVTQTKSALLKNSILATFTDTAPAPASSYTTSINWGDGSITPGAVLAQPRSTFRITGTHTYEFPGDYTVSTQVSKGANDIASTWSDASVTGFTAPQVLPPFSQAHLAQIWSAVLSDTNTIDGGSVSTGGNPFSGMVTGSDGAFYGTTFNGGANADGIIYRITASGSFSVIYSFTGGNDGAHPYGPLVVSTGTATPGLMYGTAETGGTGGSGVVYSVTTSGSLTPLYSFGGTSTVGATPTSGLVQDNNNGLLYGTTVGGGINNHGTVYSLSTSGSLNTLHSFSAGTTDGGAPYAALILASDGNFYGTTTTGGSDDDGVVYQLTSSGTVNTLYSFTSGSDGAAPFAPLFEPSNGVFIGTATKGGSDGKGTIFQITSSGSFNALYSFTGGSDGAAPYSPVIQGTNNLLYGTTTAGGDAGFGTIYSLNPIEMLPSTLYSFTGGADGAAPYAPLVGGTGGLFYGTAESGGTNQFGTVYELDTNTNPDVTVNALYAFASGTGTQVSLRCAVEILNSGNKPSTAGTFQVYLGSGVAPTPGTLFSKNGVSSFPIPALAPGQFTIFTFTQYGSTDMRLKLPVNVSASGNGVSGVVNYSDPVGDFDGSAKVYSPGSL